MARITLVVGDITRQPVDAIVNAANSGLVGGGGVDGAIHRAGGPQIMAECDRIRAAKGGCPTGSAVATTAGDLPARWVIHAVGPVWSGGRSGEAELLSSAYSTSLEVAASLGARSVAFPSLSTGAYRYPVAEAAEIALTTIFTVTDDLAGAFDLVRMVLFSQKDFDVYEAARARLVALRAARG